MRSKIFLILNMLITLIIVLIITCLGNDCLAYSKLEIFESSKVAEAYQSGKKYLFRIKQNDGTYSYYERAEDFQAWQYPPIEANPSNYYDELTIEFLQPECQLTSSITTYYNYPLHFVTAPVSDSDYGYQGTPGTSAVIKRANSYTGNMFTTTNGELTFENLVIDGGWQDNRKGTATGGALINNDGAALVTLTNVILRNNNNTTSEGGAIRACGDNEFEFNNVQITNCQASNGGAIYCTNTTATYNNVTVTNCCATGSGNQIASAIYSSPSDYSYYNRFNGLTITECSAINATGSGSAFFVNSQGNYIVSNTASGAPGLVITNNYSSGDKAGFAIVRGSWYPKIEIYGDMVIDNNYTGCSFNKNNKATKKGDEVNLFIQKEAEDQTLVTFHYSPTSNSKVGVVTAYTIQGTSNYKTEDAATKEATIFANADNSITGLENYFYDGNTSITGKTDGSGHAVFEGDSSLSPLGRVIIKYIDYDAGTATAINSISGPIEYVKDGQSTTEYNVNYTNGTTIERIVDPNTNINVYLYWIPDGVTVSYTLSAGATSTFTVNQANGGRVSGQLNPRETITILYEHGTKPAGNKTSDLTFKHVDSGNYADKTKKHSYRVVYTLNGESKNEVYELADGETQKITIDQGTTYTISLDETSDGNYGITYTMPSGNTANPTVSSANVSISGTIDADGEGQVTFTHTLNKAVETGFTDNIPMICMLSGIVIISLLLVKKFKIKD